MKIARRLAITLALAAIVSFIGYGAGWGLRSASIPADTPGAGSTQAGPAIGGDEPGIGRPATDRPATGTPTSDPTRPAQDPTGGPTEEPVEEPGLRAGPRLMGPGDEGDRVRILQARLRQIDWFEGDVTGVYGDLTAEAVRGFQAKREIPVTGEVDQRTLDRLHGMTTEPTRAELSNRMPSANANTPGPLDPRCTTGRVLCVDKSSSTLRWVVDGEVRQTLDTRFGGSSTPTREGVFSVFLKSRDHVSSLYDTSMPFAMFFSGGQAVHYSPDFAAVGYGGASHGCVNVRDYDGIAALYDRVTVGDKVVVYWS